MVSNTANTSKGNVSLCGERCSRQPPGIRGREGGRRKGAGEGEQGGVCLRDPLVWASPLHVCLGLKPRAASCPPSGKTSVHTKFPQTWEVQGSWASGNTAAASAPNKDKQSARSRVPRQGSALWLHEQHTNPTGRSTDETPKSTVIPGGEWAGRSKGPKQQVGKARGASLVLPARARV